MANEIKDVVIWQGSGAVVELALMSEATSPTGTGTLYTQSSFSALSLSLYRLYRGRMTAVSGYTDLPLTISSVIFNTAQGWSEDSVGYNFRYFFPAAAFVGNAEYIPLLKCTLTDGQVFIPTNPPKIKVKAIEDGGAIAGGGTSTTVTGELLYVATASAALQNTTDEGTLIGGGSGSLNVAANSQTAGDTFIIEASGFYSTDAVVGPYFDWLAKWSTECTLTVRLYLPPSQSSQPWNAKAVFTRRTIGASGTLVGRLSVEAFTPAGPITGCAVTSGNQTSDTTVSAALALRGDWETADSENIITGQQAELYKRRISS